MKNSILNVLIILIGNFLLAVAITCLIVPNNILSGGLAGIAVALQPILPFMNATTFISVTTILLFVLGALCLGKDFLIKTLLSAISFPVFLYILEYIVGNKQFTDNPMLASIYSGVLVGIGIGFVFRTGSSTGGVDILALLAEKYFRLPSHIGCMIIDGSIVVLGITMYSIHDAMIGLLSVVVTSFMIDKTLSFGGQKAKSVMVISDLYEEILKRITSEIDRGATLLHAEGGYSRNGKEVILCVIESNQYPGFNKMISEIDPNAFLIVQDAQEVKGDGFTYYSDLRLKTLKKKRSIYEK